MEKEIIEIITQTHLTPKEQSNKVLDLFSVMLSEAKQQAITHKALKYDNCIYDKPITDSYDEAMFIMESIIKKRIHSA